MNPGDIFQAIEKLQDNVGVKAVFGEPIVQDDKIIIPVASVLYGFGFGYGEGDQSEQAATDEANATTGGGGGMAGTSNPRAVIEISADQVRVLPIMQESLIALAGIFTGVWAIFWSALTLKAIFGKK